MAGTLLAIDSNSLMHRAYWALPQMEDAEKRPTNAVYGFFMMLFRIVEEYQPDHIMCAFDMKEKTFRHAVYSEYKAGRQKTPDDLNIQFSLLKDALSMIDVKYVEMEGYEADDIIGGFSKMAENAGLRTYIFTGDRDELQLIDDNVNVVLTKKGVTETKLMTRNTLMEELSLTPEQITDLKGLMGDASDNIPGIAGVGEKTALKLLHEYGTVENLYENLDKLPKNKMHEKIENGKDSAFLSKRLATIESGLPLEQNLDDVKFAGFDAGKLKEMFEKYRFKSLLKRFDLGSDAVKKEAVPVPQADRVVLGLDELGVLDDANEMAFVLEKDFCFTVDGAKDYVLAVKETLLDEGYDLAEILKAVAPRMKGKHIIGHNIKKWMHELESYGASFDTYYDIMLADWVLNPSLGKYDLASVMDRNELSHSASHVYELATLQKKEINEKELEGILFEIELPLLRILYEMERDGFYVSGEELVKLGEQYDEQIANLTQSIYELADMEFNINSTKQLAEVLFEKLHLPVIKKTKTGYSTDVEVLEQLQDKHEIIGYIMEYRMLTKLKGTYVDGLIGLIKNGYIHTTFLQTVAATGRLSSVEPNLQNIPIRSSLAHDIRNAFLAPQGYTIISADYSQIELRILAHIADDHNMKQAFLNGEDIHARTAAEVLKKDIKDVTPQERASAKATNFGIVYGISEFGLARNTGLSRKEAGQYIKRYLEEFSGVKQYMEEIVKQAHKDGYVRSLFGRIRYIPELASKNYNIRAAGERFALNTPMQGTAADIIKIAMIRAAAEIRKQGLKSRLVLQVHDELIVYAAEGEEDAVKKILQDSMQNAAQLSVPLAVHIAAGNTWAEAK